MNLGDLTPDAFLRDYWQKKPLLVRGAVPGMAELQTPDDLMDLAAEEDVTSRLVLEDGGDYPWELKYGPFPRSTFRQLPKAKWSLLVQEVDRLLPEVADLLERFRFIPNWRIDDVMVSYAPAAGGVGAHIDNYDVFLIQGHGRRRWRINHTPVQDEVLVPDLDVSLLAGFEADAEWELEPGDLLYLPPRIAHEGVALGPCMTFSVGFRAPSHLDLVTGFLDHVATTLDPDTRYADPDLTPQDPPGEITADALARVRAVLHGLLDDPETLHAWFGQYMTEPKRGSYALPPDEPFTEDDLRATLADGAVLQRSAVADFAFIRHDDGTATLFVAGTAYPLDTTLADAAPLLTGTATLDNATLAPHLDESTFAALVLDLVNEGVLIPLA